MKSTDGLPASFGRYRIIRELGAGAMGTVYLAHDTTLDRQVAIKTPSFREQGGDELIARFYREAKAAAKLQHRNICQTYDVGTIDGRHFISMAYVKGRTLAHHISRDELPPLRTSALLVRRLALALAEAHRHNVIHRDLKPANIMIDDKREPIVMDFGLARQADAESEMTQSGIAVGTPAYMSPEQVRGEQGKLGPTTDIYALGVILYELLAGRLPFRGSVAQVVYQIVKEHPPAPSTLNPEVDVEIEVIWAKMMAKNCDERFQSMNEVAAALKDYLTGSRPPESAEPPADETHGEASITARHPGEKATETAALHAFFADQAGQDAMQSQADRLGPKDSAEPLGVSQELPLPSKGRPSILKATLLAASAGMLLLWGMTFLVRTPRGTLRVETIGKLDGLQVIVDGNTISLTEPEKISAEAHAFALKLNGSELVFDPKTTLFKLNQPGAEQGISVSIGGAKISGNEFVVTQEGETVLKISRIVSDDGVVSSESDMQRFFAGKVESYDPTSGRIVLAYDFSDPKQQDDWRPASWKELDPGGSWEVVSGKLRLTNTSSLLLLKPDFGDVEISCEFSVIGGKTGDVCLVVGAQEQGIRLSFYGLMGLKNHETCELRRIDAAGNWMESEKVDPGEERPSPFSSQFQGRLSLQRRLQEVIGRVGDLELKGTRDANARGHVGVWAEGTVVDFDNIRVEGVFDPTTMEGLDADSQDGTLVSSKELLPTLRLQLNRSQSYEFPIRIPRFSSGAGLLEIRVAESGDNSGDRGMYTKLYDDARATWVGSWFEANAAWRSFLHTAPSGSDWKVLVEDNDTSTRNPQPHNYVDLTVRVLPQMLPLKGWNTKFLPLAAEVSKNASRVSDAVWDEIVQSEPLDERLLDDIGFQFHKNSELPGPRLCPLSDKVPADFFALVADADYKLPAGKYLFLIHTDDGIRVNLNDERIIDEWQGGPHHKLLEKVLTDGEYSVHLEYFSVAGPSYLRFAVIPIAE